MSNYQPQQQHQQQPRPYHPGQGQPPPAQHPGQQGPYGGPVNPQQQQYQQQQQQQPLKPLGGSFGNVRPGGPISGNQAIRPGPGQMAPGVRPGPPGTVMLHLGLDWLRNWRVTMTLRSALLSVSTRIPNGKTTQRRPTSPTTAATTVYRRTPSWSTRC
ncbi:hypothetical protein BGX23_002298 [Mortierella sp. AD031]|nr:hypothetical protein BGX23_002298 [Mortierella sp. AD031]